MLACIGTAVVCHVAATCGSLTTPCAWCVEEEEARKASYMTWMGKYWLNRQLRMAQTKSLIGLRLVVDSGCCLCSVESEIPGLHTSWDFSAYCIGVGQPGYWWWTACTSISITAWSSCAWSSVWGCVEHAEGGRMAFCSVSPDSAYYISTHRAAGAGSAAGAGGPFNGALHLRRLAPQWNTPMNWA